MKGLQKAGGIGALVHGLIWPTTLLYFFVVLPAYGFIGPYDLNNPAKVLSVVPNAPILSLFNASDALLAFTLLLVVLALHDRLHAGSSGLVRIATTSGLLATLLFFASGMVRFIAVSELASIYPHNQTGAAAAYLAANAILSGLISAATFTYGGWALLASWAALRTGGLPRGLNYLGLLLGGASILLSFIYAVGALATVVAVVWALWLGLVLLRDRSSEATALAPARTA
jgi:hypothetical protein